MRRRLRARRRSSSGCSTSTTATFADALEDRGFAVSASSRASYAARPTSRWRHARHGLRRRAGQRPWTSPSPSSARTCEAQRRRSADSTSSATSTSTRPGSGCRGSRATTTVDRVPPAPGRPRRSTTEVEPALLDLTPLALAGRSSATPYTEPVQVVDELDGAGATAVDEPFFLVAHVSTPHWPYRYGDDCVRPGRRPSTPTVLDATSERHGGLRPGPIDVPEPLVLAAIDRDRGRRPRRHRHHPVRPRLGLLLQLARGPDGWNSAALNEHFSVLNAMRLPAVCEERSIEGSSPWSTPSGSCSRASRVPTRAAALAGLPLAARRARADRGARPGPLRAGARPATRRHRVVIVGVRLLAVRRCQ